MTASSPLESLRISQDLVCRFFAVFSRFEYAMKAAGFVHTNRFGRAMPDWEAFSASISLVVPSTSDLHQAIEFLVSEPPMVQTGANEWASAPLRGASPAAMALDAVQRVRNNLFHGGKYAPHSPPGRDELLVRSALAVLDACVAQHHGVGSVYQ
jgi:hypothetical protein